MYYVRKPELKIEEKVLFPEASDHFLFDFELSKIRLLERNVDLPCYVLLENEKIDEVLDKFPKKGDLKILAYIDRGPEVYEKVNKGKKETVEIVNRCDIDFALHYLPLNTVEFLLHLHEGSRVESKELIEECKLYHDGLNEWFFNHKNFFKYNEFFHQIENKIIDRYRRLTKKGSQVRLLNCDGKPLTFVSKIEFRKARSSASSSRKN